MFSLLHQSTRLCDGIDRREWLRCGSVGLGALSLSQLLTHRAHANSEIVHRPRFGQAKSVIAVCLLGGPGQHETWDPKPQAPPEVRGPFGLIDTAVHGIQVSELMPLTARHTDVTAVLRATVTDDNAHSSSGYQMLTGVPHIPMNVENATPKFPNRHPSFAAIVRHHRSIVNGLPGAIQLPQHIALHRGGLHRNHCPLHLWRALSLALAAGCSGRCAGCRCGGGARSCQQQEGSDTASGEQRANRRHRVTSLGPGGRR